MQKKSNHIRIIVQKSAFGRGKSPSRQSELAYSALQSSISASMKLAFCQGNFSSSGLVNSCGTAPFSMAPGLSDAANSSLILAPLGALSDSCKVFLRIPYLRKLFLPAGKNPTWVYFLPLLLTDTVTSRKLPGSRVLKFSKTLFSAGSCGISRGGCPFSAGKYDLSNIRCSCRFAGRFPAKADRYFPADRRSAVPGHPLKVC